MDKKTSSKTKDKKKSFTSRLRIKVQGYEHTLLDESVRQIIDTANRLGANTAGPIPMPTSMKKYTVNRSTFVHKDAREQLETRIHNRLIDILDPSQQVVEALSNLTLPVGISVEVRMD